VTEAVLVHEGLVPLRLFEGVQGLTLKVFNERKHKERVIVDLAGDRRDLRPTKLPDGAQAALSGYQLVLAKKLRSWAEQERLQQTILFDGLGQLR
jgi:hypothetical protein